MTDPVTLTFTEEVIAITRALLVFAVIVLFAVAVMPPGDPNE
jgi:hypothetical protein